MKALKLLLLILVVGSCQSKPTYKWSKRNLTFSINPVVLKGVDQAKANEVIRKAFKTWSDVGVLNLKYTMTKGDIEVNSADISEKSVQGFGYFPPHGGLYIDNSDILWTEEKLYKVALHEIGHCLGLIHSKDKKSIMYYSITSIDTLSPWDKENLRKLYKELN